MFAPQEAGEIGVKVVICTGQGFETITFDEDGNPTKQTDKKQSDRPCDYGTMPVAFQGEDPQPLLLLTRELEAIEHARFDAFVLSAKRQTTRLARGPPARVLI